MSVLDFTLPRKYGGYGISNIVLHLKLCFIKPIMLYMKEKLNDEVMSKSSFFVEYNLGHSLSNYFDLNRNNSTVHRFRPNEYYEKMFEIIKMYDISTEELADGKISQIYYRILCDIGAERGKGPDYCIV